MRAAGKARIVQDKAKKREEKQRDERASACEGKSRDEERKRVECIEKESQRKRKGLEPTFLSSQVIRSCNQGFRWPDADTA